ncbi:secretory pathway protein Sec39-domain-containing protein [Jimgerdemannia flammicorona]|uniref:Secretory pathway protein Sec39-domain-containing protein n=1 Tax=Jimgerdemannia flammicorona TaxID=994334 RepID=A0A433DL68_9FUNG|nr:secretory pathway protein Sec39-domain-containing protein [Jimgerdemannia flammicorona]
MLGLPLQLPFLTSPPHLLTSSPEPLGPQAMGDTTTHLLYDINISATWSTEQDTTNSYDSPALSYRRVANVLARELDGIIVSTTVPPALLQTLPKLRSDWQLSLSPDGQLLAVFQESRIEIRPKKSEFETAHAYYNTGRDPFSKWRKLAWSPDSKLVVASRSDGTVEVLDTEGKLVCAIMSKLAANTSATAFAEPTDPATDSNNDTGHITSPPSNQLDFASSRTFFIEPFAHVAFVDPRRGLRKPRTVEGHVYAYELLTVTYNGTVRSYLLNTAETAASSSGNPAMRLPRSTTTYVTDQQNSDPNYFVFHHRFSVAPCMAAVTCGVVDAQKGVLCLGGRLRGPHVKAGLNEKGEDDEYVASGMTFWKMTYEQPYYQRLESSDGGESVGADGDDAMSYLAQFKGAVASLTHYGARAHWNELVLTIVPSPDYQHVVTLDLSGTVRVWRTLWHHKDHKSGDHPAVALSHTWDRSQLNHFARSKEYSDLSSSALAKQIESHHRDGDDLAMIPGLENGRVVSIQWWSADALILGYARGTVIIARLPLMNNILGTQPEIFRSCLEIAATSAHDQFLVLEYATKRLKAQVQGERLVALPQDSEPESKNDLPALDFDVELSTSPLSTPLVRVVTALARSLLRLLSSQPTVDITISQRHVRLIRATLILPLEYLHQKISAEEYDAALIVAKDFGLDADVVFQAQWRTVKVVDMEVVGRVLGSIKNKEWVVRACLERVPRNLEEAKTLFEYGLRQTDVMMRQVVEKVGGGAGAGRGEIQVVLSKEERVMLRSRLRFLTYLDRLKTFEEITKPRAELAKNEHGVQHDQDTTHDGGALGVGDGLDSYFVSGYTRFRNADLVSEAVAFARSEDFDALAGLFTRHGEEVLPYRLAILENVPETTDPDVYERFLPRVVCSDDDEEEQEEEERQEARWREEPWREKDWIEREAVRKLVVGLDDEDEDQPRKGATEALEPTPYPAPASTITQWYVARAHAIDEHSGQVNHALTLVQQGVAGGVRGLERLEEDLTALSRLVYECCPDTSSVATELDLVAFEALAEPEVVELYLRGTNAERIVEDMRRFVVPYLRAIRRRRAREGKGKLKDGKLEDVMELLYQYLLNVSVKHLDRCCLVIEASKPTLSYEERVITDDVELARVALAVLYGSDAVDQLPLVTRIFESLPVFEDIDDASAAEENQVSPINIRTLSPRLGPHDFFPALRTFDERALTSAIDQLEIHLNAAEILSRYLAAVPLRWFLQSSGDVDAQRKLCVRLAAQAAGGVEKGGERLESEDEWMLLLEDMLKLQDGGAGVLGTIPEEEMHTHFVTRFRLAREVLFPQDRPRPLDLQVTEKLVIDASREFFDNAESGNMNTGNLKLAYEWLVSYWHSFFRSLKIVSASPAIRAELDLIEATHQLTEYKVYHRPGIRIMPIQIRQASNRLDLISRLLSTNPEAYRQSSRIVELARKLGYRNDRVAEIRVMAMLADAALRDEHYEVTYHMCMDLVEKGRKAATPLGNSTTKTEINDVSWRICYEVGKNEAYRDLEKRMTLIALALTMCPREHAVDILNVWRRLEVEMAASITAQAAAAQKSSSTSLLNQWATLGGVLSSGDTDAHRHAHKGQQPHQEGVETGRKRDQIKKIVGGWLW